MSLAALFRRAAQDAGDREFLVGWSSGKREVVERVTFAEYMLRASLVARSLSVEGGKPIALLSSPSIAYFVCVGGVYLGGGVVINFSWQQSPAALAHAVEALSPAILVVSTACVPLSKAAERLAPNFAARRVLDGSGADALITTLPTPAPSLPPALAGEKVLTKATVAAIFFTAGSTGYPKAVPLAHGGLLWACEQRLLRLGGRDAVSRGVLSFSSASHVSMLVHSFVFAAYAQVRHLRVIQGLGRGGG